MNISKFPDKWGEIVEFSKKKAIGDSFFANVFKCFFGALIYNVWKERNARVHGKNKRSEDQVWKDIVLDGNALIFTWRGIPVNDRNSEICQRWSIPLRIISIKGNH